MRAAELALAEAPALMWRVERAKPPLRFSRIDPVDAMNDRAGNRFDVPGAGVLYASTTPQGAFAETLGGFRPSASLIARLAARTRGPVPATPGEVPREWRQRRRLRGLSTRDALPFVDVEDPRTHLALVRAAPGLLTELGLANLDVATVRGPSRTVTRALARWVFGQTDDRGDPLYSGLRYVSKLGDFECWAVFEGTAVTLVEDDSITLRNPELREVAQTFGLVIR
jgi:hypothetical protein